MVYVPLEPPRSLFSRIYSFWLLLCQWKDEVSDFLTWIIYSRCIYNYHRLLGFVYRNHSEFRFCTVQQVAGMFFLFSSPLDFMSLCGNSYNQIISVKPCVFQLDWIFRELYMRLYMVIFVTTNEQDSLIHFEIIFSIQSNAHSFFIYWTVKHKNRYLIHVIKILIKINIDQVTPLLNKTGLPEIIYL